MDLANDQEKVIALAWQRLLKQEDGFFALVAVDALLLARRPDSARARKVAAVGAAADLALLPALLAVGPLFSWLAAPTIVAIAGWLILVAALGVLVLLPEPGSPPLPLPGSESGYSPAERDQADLGSRS